MNGSEETSCPLEYQKRAAQFKGVGLHYTGLAATIRVPVSANADSTGHFFKPCEGWVSLQAFSEGQIDPTWIDAFLLTPASAVGVFFSGGTIFSAFDTDGDLIVSEQFSAGGSDHFIGFVSDVPIGFTMNNSDPGLEAIESYVFVP
ncbi:MAG: hypothetical protein IIB57_05375, partial [Planctomycetes bacterium]|nr:hypothetical protein [Planctomycetota bacterium]